VNGAIESVMPVVSGIGLPRRRQSNGDDLHVKKAYTNGSRFYESSAMVA
jgi:hypothetical protein